MVADYMKSPELRWDAAMRRRRRPVADQLLASARSPPQPRSRTNSNVKSSKSGTASSSLRDWVVDPDANVDREKRIRAAMRVVDWLKKDERAAYYRVHAIQQSMSVQPGDELQLADCADITSKRHGDPLPRHLREFLHEWATVTVPKRWEEHMAEHEEGAPWLDPNDMNAFARYLRDYLLTDEVFDALTERLGPIVHLKTRDEAARRRARRKYVQIIMNDFVMNPGPSMTPIKSPQKRPASCPAAGRRPAAAEEPAFDRF